MELSDTPLAGAAGFPGAMEAPVSKSDAQQLFGMPQDVGGMPPLGEQDPALQQKIDEVRDFLLKPPQELDSVEIDPSIRTINGMSLSIPHQVDDRSIAVKAAQQVSQIFQQVCSAVYQTGCSFFGRKLPEIFDAQELLSELCLRGALSPAQKKAVEEQLPQDPELTQDSESASISLCGFLRFSLPEAQPILLRAQELHPNSPGAPIAALLLAHLCRSVASNPNAKALLGPKDVERLESVVLSRGMSRESLYSSLQFMRELSDRLTIHSWIQKLPDLLKRELVLPDPAVEAITEALRTNSMPAFKAALVPLLEAYNKHPITAESCYVKDLLEALTKEISFQELALDINKQQFLATVHVKIKAFKQMAKRCVELGRNIPYVYNQLRLFTKDIERKKIIDGLRFAQPLICATFGASEVGGVKRTARKIETLTRKTLRLLGQERSVEPHKEVAFLTCSCGGGHRRMMRSLTSCLDAPELARASRFPVSHSVVDIPVEVTRPVDPVYNLLKRFGNLDMTWLYNFLLSRDWCWAINKLRSFGGEPTEESQAPKQALIRRAMLALAPDLLNLAYTFDGTDIDTVAAQLGLPLLHVATDLDLSGWNQVPRSLFATAVPTRSDETMSRSLADTPEGVRVEEIGLSVGPAIEDQSSADAIPALRREYEERFSIKPGSQIILISNGRHAFRNKIPEILARDYANSEVPIHLIVACGTNEKYRRDLERSIIPSIRHQDAITIQALGDQLPDEMTRLMRVCDRYIGKPGGMSTMDLWKTRACRQDPGIIFDLTSYRLSWERINAQVLVNRGMATTLERCDDIMRLVREPVTPGFDRQDDVASIRASVRYCALVQELLQEAQAEHFQEAQKSWYRMGKRMVQLSQPLAI